MAYTGHKSSTSLVHYDTLDHEQGAVISNILMGAKETYTRHVPPPITAMMTLYRQLID